MKLTVFFKLRKAKKVFRKITENEHETSITSDRFEPADRSTKRASGSSGSYTVSSSAARITFQKTRNSKSVQNQSKSASSITSNER